MYRSPCCWAPHTRLLLELLHAVLRAGGVRLEADRLDADVRSAPAGTLAQLGRDVGLLVVDDLGADLALHHLQPVREAVDRDDSLGAEDHGRARRHLAHGTAAPHRDDVAGSHAAEVGGHPAGRRGVGRLEARPGAPAGGGRCP
jgi:hypothetical protein